MDLRLSPEEEAFQAEARMWLEENLPEDWRRIGIGGFQPDERADTRRRWQRRLYDGGWMKLAWPAEAGGRGATPVMEHIFHEEQLAIGAPVIMGLLGAALVVPVLLAHGSPWQRRTYVEPILAGDLLFCQGFSEPDAGSDLAALATRAEPVSGRWLINGQKTWSSFAPQADHCFLLARTAGEEARHRGISLFLLDMKQPGVSVRPVRQMTGGGDFAEVFFTDALVEERDVVGPHGQGWRIAMSALGFERGSMAAVAAGAEQTMAALLRLVRGAGLGGSALARQRVAQARIETSIFRLTLLRGLTRARKGLPPGPEASLVKLMWTEMDKRLQDSGLAFQGMAGALAPGERRAWEEGDWQSAWLWAQAGTIYGGSSEIQRNVVAERLLGLPRSR